MMLEASAHHQEQDGEADDQDNPTRRYAPLDRQHIEESGPTFFGRLFPVYSLHESTRKALSSEINQPKRQVASWLLYNSHQNRNKDFFPPSFDFNCFRYLMYSVISWSKKKGKQLRLCRKPLSSRIFKSAWIALNWSSVKSGGPAFAPRKKVLGGGLIDLRVDEGIQKMMALVDHVVPSQPTGDAMLISLSHAQLEAGVGYHLLDHSSTTIPHLTVCWIAGLWQFLGRHAISIYLRQAQMVQLEHV
jgi:hypothetical protein